MLEDKQIDELERLIVFSELKDLPMILSRAIPLLFSELRLVKATLDSKVSTFLGGFDGPTRGTGVAEEDSEAEVRGRGVGMGTVGKAHGGIQELDSHGAGRPDQSEEVGERIAPKRGRGRPKGSRNKGPVDSRGDEPAVGGSEPQQPRGSSAISIEPSSRLMHLSKEMGGE